MGVLGQTENGPPPSLRSLASIADLTLGAEGARLMQALFAPATAVTEAALGDDRLRGPLDHWAAHSQQPPQAPGPAPAPSSSPPHTASRRSAPPEAQGEPSMRWSAAWKLPAAS